MNLFQKKYNSISVCFSVIIFLIRKHCTNHTNIVTNQDLIKKLITQRQRAATRQQKKNNCFIVYIEIFNFFVPCYSTRPVQFKSYAPKEMQINRIYTVIKHLAWDRRDILGENICWGSTLIRSPLLLPF